MTVRELREKYLRFFESKGHQRFPAASLVPYDVTGRLDESLLFTGAGMIQFKPFFRGVARPDHLRLITCQPCVRTGDIDEIGDDTHLSFFEMLGNFSFGDYFKAQAIAFSWEFLTDKQWLGLDPRRLSFSIFEDDEEAYNEWAFWLTPAGLEPASRIVRLGEESNYWPANAFSAGPPGPCGPNSEMFYWTSKEEPPGNDYTQEDWVRDEAAGKWVEIWNDVFIQYEWQGHLKDPSNSKLGYEKDGMPELPFKSIDTGMGLDRTAIVLGGHKSIYEIDVFQPIFAKIRGLRGAGVPPAGSREERAERIVADHLRTASFCIADGILPGNTGRGYVLRRLIRRATLQGQRVLGFNEPFLHIVYEGLVESMGDFYTSLIDQREMIVETLRNEETLFRRTLSNGLRLLAEQMDALIAQRKSSYSGTAAFQLYDTYGFPLEITQEILSESGFTLNVEAYEAALAEAQIRSRKAQGDTSAYGGVTAAEELTADDAPGFTTFLGYSGVDAEARVVRIRPAGEGLLVALDRTPFYAESGGQTGDHGTLTLPDGTALPVDNTTKSGGTFWHHVSAKEIEPEKLLGQTVRAQVLGARRDRIRRNHTATHLLQAALRQTLGTHVAQAGSYVGPDNLRFDFTHSKAMTPEEIERVERSVNEQALANTEVTTYVDLPIDEARAKGAMALFGEKYGDRVRMVEIGDFSRELCGGIHVRTTGEIGLFKIVSESSAASGVRRIEAITGEGAYEWVLEETKRLREAAALLKTSPRELVPAIERTVEAAKEERRRREKAEMASMGGGTATAERSDAIDVGPVVLWRRNFGDVDPKLAANAVDNAAAAKPNQVTLAAVVSNGKPQFICKCGTDAVTAGAHAGNLLREVAKIAGGGGGGRPDFATAGGRDAGKVDEALEAAAKILATMVGVSAD
ncbi:alanine--tRNA ligase [Fimbriimonas ginsengisoli]|uniref:Alanine--tRNA ligase n=1 Tax=Fimbriimonas ginsengisoli Gsoil 348 TaxID=661478 RepID=A0A068NQ92_FIMGI|nr:alanine--tRNA ligase [Fimbriimonas ginsengisoli]AIE84930.1 alanyl-tRNA synthetase [Fimbriimonas ginsengisoli Gsoil 348]